MVPALSDLVRDLGERVRVARLGGPEASRRRHLDRGKLLARTRIDLLIGIVIGSMEKARRQEATVPDDDSDADLLERIAQLQQSLSGLEDDLRRRVSPPG